MDGCPQTLLTQCCSQRQACAAVLSSASPLCTVNTSFDDIRIFDRKHFHQRDVGSWHSCFRARLGLATRLFRVKVNLGFRSQPVQKRISLPWKVHINNKLFPNVTELATYQRLVPSIRYLFRRLAVKRAQTVAHSVAVSPVFAVVSSIRLQSTGAGSDLVDWKVSCDRLLVFTTVWRVSMFFIFSHKV